MKNVLLITQGFPYGESERGFLPTEYEALSRHFHLTVLAFGKDAPLLYPLMDGVEHLRYDWGGSLTPAGLLRQLGRKEVRQDIIKAAGEGMAMFPKRAAKILAYSYRAEQVTAMLRSLIEDKQIDVVYTYWCVQITIAALRLKKEFPRLKVVTRFHGMDLYPEQTAEWWEPLMPFVAQNSDLMLFVSHLGKQFFLDNWGQQWEEKAKVSYVGCRSLPMAELLAEETITLVSCSALIPIKRVHRIVEGLAALPEKLQVHWHHFGDGECGDALKKQAAEQLTDCRNIRYTFHGYIQNMLLPQMYRQIGAALFITTSETEGLPVSMMEAFAMGIPVIATGVGGIPEMVRDGENGYLLSPDASACQVAQAIERFSSLTAKQKEQMGKNALESWQQNFNAAANAENLMYLLEKL